MFYGIFFIIIGLWKFFEKLLGKLLWAFDETFHEKFHDEILRATIFFTLEQGRPTLVLGPKFQENSQSLANCDPKWKSENYHHSSSLLGPRSLFQKIHFKWLYNEWWIWIFIETKTQVMEISSTLSIVAKPN
jgi:hypothetical protein